MEEVIVAKSRNKNLSSRKELELLDKQVGYKLFYFYKNNF